MGPAAALIAHTYRQDVLEQVVEAFSQLPTLARPHKIDKRSLDLRASAWQSVSVCMVAQALLVPQREDRRASVT